MRGTRSTRAVSALRACTSGLKPSASRAADGRRIPHGIALSNHERKKLERKLDQVKSGLERLRERFLGELAFLSRPVFAETTFCVFNTCVTRK